MEEERAVHRSPVRLRARVVVCLAVLAVGATGCRPQVEPTEEVLAGIIGCYESFVGPWTTSDATLYEGVPIHLEPERHDWKDAGFVASYAGQDTLPNITRWILQEPTGEWYFTRKDRIRLDWYGPTISQFHPAATLKLQLIGDSLVGRAVLESGDDRHSWPVAAARIPCPDPDRSVDAYLAVLEHMDVPDPDSFLVLEQLYRSDGFLPVRTAQALARNGHAVEGLDPRTPEMVQTTVALSTPKPYGERRLLVEIHVETRLVQDQWIGYSDLVKYLVDCGANACTVEKEMERVHSDDLSPIESSSAS